MASRRNLLLVLLVCCFVTLGLASTKFHETQQGYDGTESEQPAIGAESHSLSALLSTSEIRGLLEKFAPAIHVGKRQTGNATTSSAISDTIDSTSSQQGTTLSTTASSQASGTTASSKPSSTLVTATLTSTLPDGGISVVTQTSYSYVNAQPSGSTTTPEASLQTEGAAPKNLLQPAIAVAVGGFWVVRNII
ncbi:hypothetical protein N0V82_001851 [Gnomoniopsis sp. IMI 355080]|nr:hypothetical protein N0V82_001851 [Gnomoniopsis sp. IMI 355080]